jgi:hypothetical protein
MHDAGPGASAEHGRTPRPRDICVSVSLRAEAHRAPMPLASLLRDHLLTVLAQGGDAQDWSALGRLAARNAGL